MASRPILSPFHIITNGDMSGDVTSIVSIIQNTSQISYDVSWAGSSPVGTISVEVSNTYSQNGAGDVYNGGDWTVLPLAGPTAINGVIPISGNTGNGFIDIDSISAYAIRLVYSRTSGTGSLQATIAGKVA